MEYNESQILSLISHIHTLAQDYTTSLLGQNKFSSSHGHILFILSTQNELTFKELSEKINRNKSTTTVLIKKLEEQDLIKIQKSETDKREKLISLTTKGKKLNALTQEIYKKLQEIISKTYTEEESKKLLSLLLKLKEELLFINNKD